MIFQKADGYESVVILVEENPSDGEFYTMYSYSDSDEPCIRCDKISERFAKELLEKGENARCLNGDGSDDDIWCRPQKDGTDLFLIFTYEYIIDAIINTPSIENFMQEAFTKIPYCLDDLISYIRDENDGKIDNFILENYNLSEDILDVEVYNTLIKHCHNNIKELCELYKESLKWKE